MIAGFHGLAELYKKPNFAALRKIQLLMANQSISTELFIKMVLSAWDTQNVNFSKLVESLPEEQLVKEIAPGRNSGVYLLGHIVAIHDAMQPLLGFGEKLFPDLEDIFVNNPDKSGLDQPSVPVLKDNLQVVTQKLSSRFYATAADEWFERHNAVSPDDFIKEPHRNRLNVVINRTNHLANHLGQLLLLK
jgi:hypothetical protein